jgi:hypothetical protein
VTSSHVLKIVSYSRTKEVPNGQRIDSRHLRLGGHTWFVEYPHPNGSAADNVSPSIVQYLARLLRRRSPSGISLLD